jgi:SPP1 family predicted phage head-tail adaptor
MDKIGRLDKRVSIQRRSSTKDSYGQEIDSWTTIAQVWAQVKPLGGKERMRNAAMVVESILTHTVTVRYSATLMPPLEADAWRILYGSRIFNITSSRDVEEDRRFIEFDCTEGSVNGQ